MPSTPAAPSEVADECACGPITTSVARRLRLPPLAPCSARPRRLPSIWNGWPPSTPASASGVLLSTRLPALLPLMAPLVATRTPPDTSSTAAAPTLMPAPERSVIAPPVVGAVFAAALAMPSRSAFTKRPDRSSTTPGATRMSPASVPMPATLRLAVSAVRLPPALRRLRPSAMPCALREASVRLLRSGSVSAAPGSRCTLPSLANVRLPKPAPNSPAASMRDSAGSRAGGAPSGA